MFADTNNLDQPPDNTVDMPPIPNRAALYLGPGDADEDADEDARERALRRYAGTVGLAVVAVYRDMQSWLPPGRGPGSFFLCPSRPRDNPKPLAAWI